MSNSIKIHSFPLSGHSHRAVLFAGLAGIAHEVVYVDLPSGEHKKEPYLKINPDGKVPAIQDGDVSISDSNAILVYLARKYAPSFIPTDPVLEAQVQKFLTMAAGEVAFGMCAARLITVFGEPFDPEFTQNLGNDTLQKLDKHLKDREYLVGDQMSIADVAIYSYSFLAPEGGVSLEPYPNVRRFLAKIESQKGFVPVQTTKAGLRA